MPKEKIEENAHEPYRYPLVAEIMAAVSRADFDVESLNVSGDDDHPERFTVVLTVWKSDEKARL